MKKISARKEMRHSRSLDEAYNEIHFPNGILWVQTYSFIVQDIKGTDRKYIIEIHKYNGFAMVKYYPYDWKKNPKKYELRGQKQLGYTLYKKTVIKLIVECILIMRDHLEEFGDEFVGYIGQPDKTDNKRKKEQSQRSAIYNRLTSSTLGNNEKYKIITKKKFKEINLRLIRKQKSKQQGKLTKAQKQNYDLFLEAFKANPNIHYNLMTEATRNKFII